jgi:hypothetical protein
MIEGAYTLFKKVLGWIIDHPLLSSFFYGGAKMYKTVSVIRRMFNMVRIPFKGGLIGGLLGLGAGYATQATTEAVIGMFSGESNLKEASWKLTKK